MGRPKGSRKGTIYAKAGVLYLGFYATPDATKRTIRSAGLTDTPANRKRLAAQLAKRVDQGEAVAAIAPEGPLTVRRWASRWLDTRRAQLVASVGDEATHLEAHVLPSIGEQLLDEVRPRHLVELFGALRRKKTAGGGKVTAGGSKSTLAPKTIHNIYGTVSALFRDAKLDDLLLGDSPCILTRRQLGEKVDKDPEWRPTAKYSRAELEQLISSEDIPPDRHVLYALEGLAALRHGEAAGLRWRHYLADQQPLGRLIVATSYDKGRTKTKQVRFMPVHPTLAAMLAEWKLGGWAAMYGRAPEPDDLVVPLPADPLGKRARANPRAGGGMRTKNDSRRRLERDLAALQLRHRRGHDLRRSMISLAQDDGAVKDVLKLGTHGRTRREAIDDYTSLEWGTLCREVAKLQVVRRLEVAVKVVAIGGGGAGGGGVSATVLPGHEARGHVEPIVAPVERVPAAGSQGFSYVEPFEASRAPSTSPVRLPASPPSKVLKFQHKSAAVAERVAATPEPPSRSSALGARAERVLGPQDPEGNPLRGPAGGAPEGGQPAARHGIGEVHAEGPRHGDDAVASEAGETLPGMANDEKLVERILELEAALGSIAQLLERNDPGCDEVRRLIRSDREVALAIARRMLERKLG